MNNQGPMKWAPFNSVINSNEILSSIMEEKSKIDKPVLSEEQIANLENKIIETYKQNSEIRIIYYQKGFTNTLSGKITKIDPVNKIIIINHNTNLYFHNIIDILEKNT